MLAMPTPLIEDMHLHALRLISEAMKELWHQPVLLILCANLGRAVIGEVISIYAMLHEIIGYRLDARLLI